MAERKKPEIVFPCAWEFRIIVESEKRDAAAEGIKGVFFAFGEDVELVEGGVSGGGRYRAYRTAAQVSSREMLNKLTAGLGSVEGVKMVL